MAFERSMGILSNIEGMQGALLLNFEACQMLAKPAGTLPMQVVADMTADMVHQYKNTMMDEGCRDVLEHLITISDRHYLIHYLVPYFDNVLICVVVSRLTPLPMILRSLEQAGAAMCS